MDRIQILRRLDRGWWHGASFCALLPLQGDVLEQDGDEGFVGQVVGAQVVEARVAHRQPPQALHRKRPLSIERFHETTKRKKIENAIDFA